MSRQRKKTPVTPNPSRGPVARAPVCEALESRRLLSAAPVHHGGVTPSKHLVTVSQSLAPGRETPAAKHATTANVRGGAKHPQKPQHRAKGHRADPADVVIVSATTSLVNPQTEAAGASYWSQSTTEPFTMAAALSAPNYNGHLSGRATLEGGPDLRLSGSSNPTAGANGTIDPGTKTLAVEIQNPSANEGPASIVATIAMPSF